MSWQTLAPQIFGTRQPFSGQLTQMVRIGGQGNAYVNVFMLNTSQTDYSTVRLAIKPTNEVTEAKHYLLYDVVLAPLETVIIPSIGLGPNNEMYGYSDNGATTFNITGEQINNFG
jgi:hypothetical protein